MAQEKFYIYAPTSDGGKVYMGRKLSRLKRKWTRNKSDAVIFTRQSAERQMKNIPVRGMNIERV